MAASLAPCEYKTGKVLGQGSYATVKEAVKIKTGDRYAVKMISKKLMHGREHMIINEIEILKKVSQGHPNIVTLWDYFETPNNLYLVMDLCTGGELFDRICEKGSFYEEDACTIIRIVVDAVAYLHEQNIVHRDIKPENLLFKSKDSLEDVVIADFGLSKLIPTDRFDLLRTTCGTPGYMAPEVLKKAGHGKPVDLWSIGVMAYFLLCGYMPFENRKRDNAAELDNILNARFTFNEEYWCEISESARDFIRKLLIPDPLKRLTAKEALRHPWLRKDSDTPVVPTPVKDLLPHVREGFNARKVFRKAVDVVKAVNKLSHSPNASRLHLAASGSNLNLASASTSGPLATSNNNLAPPQPTLKKSGSDISISEVRPVEDPLTDGHLYVLPKPKLPPK